MRRIVSVCLAGEAEHLACPDALTLWAEARRFVQAVTDEPWNDLSGFDLRLEAMAEYAA